MRPPGRRGLARRILASLALLILAIPALALGLVWWTLPGPPAGLAAQVSFDPLGVPTIRAADEAQAATAIGYLHARDRLFQMEMLRRTAEGRVSEIAGPATLRLDRLTRLLALSRRAEADYAALSPETRAVLDAYVEGVNALIAQRGRFAAPEFLFLGPPEPWRPAQSLLWAKLMGLSLSDNWRSELARLDLAPRLAADRLWDLWPTDPSAGRPDTAHLRAPHLRALGPLLAHVPVFGEDFPLPATASNAWAIARGDGGAPILASDPHLNYGAPIIWYLARVELPGRTLVGATSPGIPFHLIGRNNRLAWGFTTTHSDTQDIFIESEAAITTVREETIRIRGAAPETFRIRETANGPVLSDLEPTSGTPGNSILAVRMANLEPRDTAATGILALNRATTIAEARAAAALITSPPQNLMVADAAGGIAMYLTGRTPRRAPGHDGALPAEAAPWRGFIPFDDLPHVERPASGVLVNANNRVQPEGALPYLGRDWHGDWRFRRIHALLAEQPSPTAAHSVAIQRDIVSLPARETLPLLNALPRGEGTLATAQALLAEWDGAMRPDAPQPLIWTAFTRRFRSLALSRAGVPDAPASTEFLRFLLHDPAAAWWCGGDCRSLAATALEVAVQDLATRHGPDATAWRWSSEHIARFEHPLLRFIPVLSRLTTLSTPVGGDGDTVERQDMRGPTNIAIHGGGLRFVADLGADLSTPDGVEMTIATGQSGHPLSRHWSDYFQLWR